LIGKVSFCQEKVLVLDGKYEVKEVIEAVSIKRDWPPRNENARYYMLGCLRLLLGKCVLGHNIAWHSIFSILGENLILIRKLISESPYDFSFSLHPTTLSVFNVINSQR